MNNGQYLRGIKKMRIQITWEKQTENIYLKCCRPTRCCGTELRFEIEPWFLWPVEVVYGRVVDD